MSISDAYVSEALTNTSSLGRAHGSRDATIKQRWPRENGATELAKVLEERWAQSPLEADEERSKKRTLLGL